MNNKVIVKLEEYIPLNILIYNRIEKSSTGLKYFSYSKENKSLIEFAVEEESGVLKSLKLILSKNYECIDEKLLIDNNIQICDYNNWENAECDTFKTIIYRDGVRIILSKKQTLKYLKYGNVYLGISFLEKLSEVLVIDMEKDEVMHTIRELELCK